jgi:rod shape-determining protein MreB and related proteins
MRLRPGLAVDLGTVNTLIYMAGRGLVLEEPSVIALDRASGRAVAVGTVAEALSGREPEGIEVIWPLRDGVVADLDASMIMLSAFLHRAHVHRGLRRPLAILCVPKGATKWERKAVATTIETRTPHCTVRLIDEPVAASIGAGASASGGAGAFVVDVGGGTTEVAVVVGTRVARARSLRVGGNAMDGSIVHTVKSAFGVSLGDRAAEHLKTTLGLTGGDTGWAEAVGVSAAWEGLQPVRVSGDLIAGALDPAVRAILSAVHEVLSGMPPDLAGDVAETGIQLAGGGALLLGLAERIETSTGVRTCVVDDPLRCVIRGAAGIIEHDDWLRYASAA